MREKKIMDIYDFIPPPDVAAHCRKIEHRFSPLDMAVLVYTSDKTMRVRHEAWRAIISDYPDIPIQKNPLIQLQSS